MDTSYHGLNGIASTAAPQTYPSPIALSPHHNLSNSNSPLPQTLPPLQPTTAVMQQQQQAYGSHPHTPRTPGTPNTPNSTHNLPSYQQTSQAGGQRGLYSMAPQNSYPPPYSTAGVMPQTSAASHPQPIAPAPVGGPRPPVLRPMPPGGLMSQPPYGAANLLGTADTDQPTHVVGSQGRRGILPSAPGRPAAPAPGTGNAKNNVAPQKDADGKFPCPHCTKTYLHAKHLKRHLLRHTGDRPYMCVLCRDTFSRSDILKRHFQKCSIRRGNPTGASHLSHPQAHVKKNAQAQKAALGTEGDLNHLNGLGHMPPGDNMVHPFGIVPVQDGMNNLSNDQNHLSRSSSMGRMENGAGPDKRGVPGAVMGAAQPYGGDVSNPMNNQQIPAYAMQHGQNGMPMYGGAANANQQSGLDWSQMFQPGAQQTFTNDPFPPNVGQMQTGTTNDPNTCENVSSVRSLRDFRHYSRIDPPQGSENPYQVVHRKMLDFLFPKDLPASTSPSCPNTYISPTNLEEFLDKYMHFHIHTPIIHIRTLRITETFIGLIAVMSCIGACYSDLIDSDGVRDLMDAVRQGLERSCGFLSEDGRKKSFSRDASTNDIEELQAVLLTTIIHMWNGTPQQRDRGRRVYPFMAEETRKLRMLQVTENPRSPLHQPGFSLSGFNPNDYVWDDWIEQERRLRIMYAVFAGATATGLYFNMEPLFDPFEMHLPLPCDDAAWDMDNAEDCASALGLHGADAADLMNPYGTKHPKQPEMDWAIQALLHSSYQIQPGSTNLFGKFILIHGILTLIRRAQLDGSEAQMHECGTPPPYDWMSSTEGNSGRTTPVRGVAQNMDPQSLKAVNTALDKFKRNWDVDMVTQFPPLVQVSNKPLRHGFSRDGIHFYWLAKYMLKFTHASDLRMPADSRFVQVMQLLKGVKTWVMTDGASRGEELGSIGEIDDLYGVTDLTLDMEQLFKPIPRVVDGTDTLLTKQEPGSRWPV